jgi:UDP-N-acetylglucosamine/UDP-N-acetylgalactosamine diphosphorylase
MVAGGKGTRLNFDKPKGLYRIGPASERSLFQIHFEKMRARRSRHDAPIPFLILTSSVTHTETKSFLNKMEVPFFGVDDVHLFQQGELPVVSRATLRPFRDTRGRLATSPNGHGGVLAALVDDGWLDTLTQRGIDYLYYFQVDNPLAKIVDPVFLGQHIVAMAEVSTKVVPKADPADPMGNVVEVNGCCQIVEYSDLDAQQVYWTDADGRHLFTAGSTAIHIFNVSFLKQLAPKATRMPLHLAMKQVEVNPGEPKQDGIQFERFVFDILPDAGPNYLVVETSYRDEFAPLKNAQGPDSPPLVRRAMSELYADWLERAQIRIARADGWLVELSPLIALEPDDLSRIGSNAFSVIFGKES